MLGFFNEHVTAIYTLDPETHSLQMHMREGSYHDLNGSWRLEPFDDDTTRATYSFYYRLRSIVTDYLPETAWMRMLKEQEIPLQVKAFKKRIEKGK